MLNKIAFVCAVCGKEVEVFITKPVQALISRGNPVPVPSDWGTQIVWKQDPVTGRVASVQLPICSGICLTSLQAAPDQYDIWGHKAAVQA